MQNATSHKHDYAKLGLKAGLEVHQQLDTSCFARTKRSVVLTAPLVI